MSCRWPRCGRHASSQQNALGNNNRQCTSQQAAQATIQGRTQAINYKQQAADVLRRMNETLATTVARAGQFGDAISGSALALQKFAESEGSREFGTSTDNASLALAGAAAQAKIYMQAGGIALTTAKVGAATTLGQGFQRLADSAKGAAVVE
jgi:hypothetical protein